MSRAFRLTAPEPDEHSIQDAILRYLTLDPRIAWTERFNTGAHVLEETKPNGKKSRRFIRYAFKGCADLLGQTVDGRFLAIEVKTRSGRPTSDQERFLRKVNDNNGIGFVARSVEEVQRVLNCSGIKPPGVALEPAGGNKKADGMQHVGLEQGFVTDPIVSQQEMT